MRLFVIPLVAATLISANDAGAYPPSLDNPAYSKPADKWKTLPEVEQPAAATAENDGSSSEPDPSCSDVITTARAENGLRPLVKRAPASADEPHLIYAVDRREEGCSVMVMKGNPEDIRPLPGPAEGDPLQLIPARDDQAGDDQ